LVQETKAKVEYLGGASTIEKLQTIPLNNGSGVQDSTVDLDSIRQLTLK